MEGYATTAEVADGAGVTARTVRYHAQHGHLPGSEQIGVLPRAVWLIPARYCDEATYLAAVGKAGPKRRDRSGDGE